MDIPPFEYLDRSSLQTVDDVVGELNRVLLHIEAVAATLTPLDMRDPVSKKWFIKHTGWIRMLYAKLEDILIKEAANRATSQAH